MFKSTACGLLFLIYYSTVWQTLFYGDPNNESVYVEVDPDMAQIINTESDVVTSEGISYGMTACVHLERQGQFNKLWNWARFHMQHEEGDYECKSYSEEGLWQMSSQRSHVDCWDDYDAPPHSILCMESYS